MDVPFKEGDILTLDDQIWILIFAGLKEENNAIIYHALSSIEHGALQPYLSLRTGTGIGYYYKERPIRYATMDEIHTFFTNIEKRGFRWNAKEKKLERFEYVESNV
jgi:hypothetical protein